MGFELLGSSEAAVRVLFRLSAAEANSGLEDNAGFRPRLVASGKRQAPACQCEPLLCIANHLLHLIPGRPATSSNNECKTSSKCNKILKR